jgi:uncharacterized protein
MMMWYSIKEQQVKIIILAKPKAKKSAFVKIDASGMHIALHAKPQDGEANEELIKFLADFFSIPKSKIILERGARGRHKQVTLPLTESVRKIIEKLNGE